MRRNYISNEYFQNPVFGTVNMVEESNFFGAKMLEIEDMISINSQNLIYYQQATGEQIDAAIESSIPSITYSSSSDKELNHKLILDEKQPLYIKESNTKWICEIQLTKILQNFLFATLKRFRTFEGLRQGMTKTNDVNVAVNDYITSNVLNRYKFKTVDFYISYKDLRNQNVLRYKNTWNVNVATESNKLKKIGTEFSFDGTSIRLNFSQEKPSSQYTFEYYFNLTFEKI